MNRYINFDFAIDNVLHLVEVHLKRVATMFVLCDHGLTLGMILVLALWLPLR